MPPTKKNHFNPCFWTAHWNEDYHARAIAGNRSALKARRQQVSALSVKSAKIFRTSVEGVHFDQGIGLVEITREDAETFARRYHPDKYEAFLQRNATAPYPVYLDFENVFSGIEATGAYETLLAVIERQEIASAEEKALLACFVVLQNLRSHAVLNSMLQWQEQTGRPRFEHLIRLKWMLSSPDAMYELVKPIANAHWSLFVARQPCLPLCDSPILISPEKVLVALSPTLLLEILKKVPAGEHQWRLDEHIGQRRMDEFRRRTIGNSFREIIFGRADLLNTWSATAEFQDRVRQMRNIDSYNRMVARDGDSELWLVNAFGNSP